MGKYNSSIYRVRPLMEYLSNHYDAFLAVLSLVGIGFLSQPNAYRYDGLSCTEMKLKPPKRHLLALIERMATKHHEGVRVSGRDRSALFFGEAQVRKEACERAKTQLEAAYDTLTPKDRPWFMFEGFTSPDILIEGEDYVIVCEGKWTEPHITTTTTYLSSAEEYRNQMVRHIQGALQYTSKKVYAFYIVDSECGYTNDLTRASFMAQLDRETIPLDDMEKAQVANAFCGYTTWQEIQAKLPQIVFLAKKDIV